MDPNLSEFEDPPKEASCKVRTVLTELDEERGAKLRAALAKDSIRTSRICEVLKGWGVDIGSSTVSRHRKSGCSCD